MIEPSSTDRLSPSDRLMWRMERDPVLRSPVVVVGLLDREPDQEAVRATWARATQAVARLRQRVVAGGAAGRRLRWEADPGFSIGYHVRRVRAPASGDLRAVLDLAAPWTTAAFDPARPLWECTVVDGLDGGQAAFVLKFHHTITDGVGGIDLATSVFDIDRAGGRAADRTPPPVGPPRASARAAAAFAGLARAGITTVRQPGAVAAAGTRTARSLARMLEPAPDPLSPVLRGRSLDRRLDVLELPLEALHDAARALDGTINAVFLAAVGGALHDLHQRHGHEVPALRVTMPISLRRPDDPPGGNRFAPARFVLPIDDPDLAHRVQIAGELVRRWRDEPAVGMTEVLARGIDALPERLVAPLFGSMLRNVDVDAVDVPGLVRPAYLGGAEIERMWAFAPPTGAALSVTLLSHLDTACIALLSDLEAVEDPDLLVRCLRSAFDAAIAVGRRPVAGADR